MKITNLTIERFKGVEDLQIDFRDAEGDPRFLTAFLGDNGSGKTTVLQAVALTLGLATGKLREMEDFKWTGFVAERLGSLGRTRVELQVEFSPEELEATFAAFNRLRDSRQQVAETWVPPGRNRQVTLRFENGRVRALEGPEAFFQFRGRAYIRQLNVSFAERRSLFASVGDVFFFDQFRSLEVVDMGPDDTKTSLREQLVGALAARSVNTRPGEVNMVDALEEQLDRVFPKLRFVGTQERSEGDFSPKSLFVLLESRGRRYDISEMSSGEQAVFPILWQFGRLAIAKSIVLIDELELHLHPPQQQALLRALGQLGDDCQYLITTHSSFLEEVIPDDWEVRLPGGSLCL